MSKQCTFFSIFGQVWTNKQQQQPRQEADVIRVRNTRNGLTDSDIVGAGYGNCKDAGWYSLTLADLNGQYAIVLDDILEFGLYNDTDHGHQLYQLGRHSITSEDIENGGMMLDFDLAKEK